MVEINVSYSGDLHCSATHGPSGTTLETDAPKDNQGRGESFSPTDLVATALATCVLTTMAISARKHGIELAGATCHATKEMTTTMPRKIARLGLTFKLPASVPVDRREALEAVAHACPVHRALKEEVEVPVKFEYV